jgi:hypothetical protein
MNQCALLLLALQCFLTSATRLLAIVKARGSEGGMVLSIDPSTGQSNTLANTTLPPDVGVGIGYEDHTVYYEAWDEHAQQNALMTVNSTSSQSKSVPITGNVFDFEFNAGELFGLSDTNGLTAVGTMQRGTGAFTQLNALEVPGGQDLLMGQSFDQPRRAFTFITGDSTGVSRLLTVGLDGGKTIVSGGIKGAVEGESFQLMSMSIVPSASPAKGAPTAVGVGCNLIPIPHDCALLTIDVATGNHTSKPVMLKPPSGSTPIPIYAFDKATRQLHQLFELPASQNGFPDSCVISIHTDSGVYGECITLPPAYEYLAMLERTITA